MIVQAVVKANNQSNANSQISTPVAPTPVNGFNYMVGMTTHANLCGTVTVWVVSANM